MIDRCPRGNESIRWQEFRQETGTPCVRPAQPNTTRIIRCCRRPMARWRICVGNWPTPAKPSRSAKKFSANSPPARDSQRAWLLLEDYFEKLSLSRKDFAGDDWWPRLHGRPGQAPPRATGLSVFARAPPAADGTSAARQPRSFRRSRGGGTGAAIGAATGTMAFPAHAGAPGFAARRVARDLPARSRTSTNRRGTAWASQFHLFRSRTGEKRKTLTEVIELTTRAAHEQELFQPADWEFIQWLAETHAGRSDGDETLVLSDLELLQWLARWGQGARLELAPGGGRVEVSRTGGGVDAASGKRRSGTFFHPSA